MHHTIENLETRVTQLEEIMRLQQELIRGLKSIAAGHHTALEEVGKANGLVTAAVAAVPIDGSTLLH